VLLVGRVTLGAGSSLVAGKGALGAGIGSLGAGKDVLDAETVVARSRTPGITFWVD
jgi:hypothetical protein